LFRGREPAELNHMISKLNMQDVISDVDDRLIGPDNRTELLKLFSKDRLGDLNVLSRAAIVDAIQGSARPAIREKGRPGHLPRHARRRVDRAQESD
jgi:hypothetical protein